MNVKELQELLAGFPSDLEVVMAAQPIVPAGLSYNVVGAHIRNYLPEAGAPKTRGELLDHDEDPDAYPVVEKVLVFQYRACARQLPEPSPPPEEQGTYQVLHKDQRGVLNQPHFVGSEADCKVYIGLHPTPGGLCIKPRTMSFPAMRAEDFITPKRPSGAD